MLAKWLATEPKVLIVDEPTRGIDVGTKAEVHRLLSELAGQGLAILMISSELPEVLGMADRVLVMREGRLTAELARAEATPEAVMFAATASMPTRDRRGGDRMTRHAAASSPAPISPAARAIEPASSGRARSASLIALLARDPRRHDQEPAASSSRATACATCCSRPRS